jgi:hypothetical protein
VIFSYPNLRQGIVNLLSHASEMERYISKPTALQFAYHQEMELHHFTFNDLLLRSESEMKEIAEFFISHEKELDEYYWDYRKQLPLDEKEIGGLEGYGIKHEVRFKNIVEHICGKMFFENFIP